MAEQRRVSRLNLHETDLHSNRNGNAAKSSSPSGLQAKAALQVTKESVVPTNAGGDITVPLSIAGNGVMNGGTTDATANPPINFQIWGTKTSGTQSISIAGNGILNGIIYAPQGSVTINGGGNSGNVSGSIVAKDITLNGSVKFHYDESLGYFGGGNPFRVTLWRELTTEAQRSAFSSVLSF